MPSCQVCACWTQDNALFNSYQADCLLRPKDLHIHIGVVLCEVVQLQEMSSQESESSWGQELLTNGITQSHAFLCTSATPQFIYDDDTRVRHILKDIVDLSHLQQKKWSPMKSCAWIISLWLPQYICMYTLLVIEWRKLSENFRDLIEILIMLLLPL